MFFLQNDVFTKVRQGRFIKSCHFLMRDVEFGGRAVKWPAVPWLEICAGVGNSATVFNCMENMLNSHVFKAVLLSVYILK